MKFLIRNRKKIGAVFICIILIFLILFKYYLNNINNNFDDSLSSDVADEELIGLEVDEESDSVTEVIEEMFYYVDVKGAVNQPGMYMIEQGMRVNDAIELAGGVCDNADTSLINLARKVKDEMVIIVYTRDEVIRSNTKFVMDTSINDSYDNVNDALVYVEDDSSSDNSNDSVEEDNEVKLVNINTASLEELVSLEGIGNSKAEAIISYRETNGKFETIEDILNVSGIGNSVFEKIKDYITV